MPTIIIQCEWCGRDKFPNELRYSKKLDCTVCKDCDADDPTHGEIQQRKRERAKDKAWNEGCGWCKQS